MEITEVKTYLVHPGVGAKNWLFVKLETDAGIHGWGECYTQADRDRSIECHIQELGRYLIGRSPFEIKQFTFQAYTDFASKRGSMDLYSAISGLEQAHWDIVGKTLQAPVCYLLGGPCRDRLRVYANGWARGTGAEVAECARRVVHERGFNALKFDPFPGPWREHISRDQEREAVENVRLVREAVGPDVEILVEVHRRLSPVRAIRVAHMMEEYQPYWYEEPVSSRNIDALAEVRRAVMTPVVTGEELYTKTEFRQVFEKQAADILNPDVCAVGGILELREIAAMAEPYLVAVAPHNYNSGSVGLAATLHAAIGMPNFLITEYFVNFEDVSHAISRSPIVVEGGYARIPDEPGLGVDLDEAVLAQFAYRQPEPRRLPGIETA